MTDFAVSRGLRIQGDIVAVGGADAVAELDVVINGRKSRRVVANRISHVSSQRGGSFYGGFDYAIPVGAFRGGLCVVQLYDASSGVEVGEFEFGPDEYVYEEMLLGLEYGCNIHNGKAVIPASHSEALAKTIPRYMIANSRNQEIGEPILDWLLQMVDRDMIAAAVKLFRALPLIDLIRADAIKVVQLFLRISIRSEKEINKKLTRYVEENRSMHGSDVHNMIILCLRSHHTGDKPTLEDVKLQLERWRFSSRAMAVTFEYVEAVFGPTGLSEFKAWAMSEWLASAQQPGS